MFDAENPRFVDVCTRVRLRLQLKVSTSHESTCPKSPPGGASGEVSGREAFTAFLNRKGLRVTDQRMAIYDAAIAIPEHFTAEDLLDKSRAIDDSVSRATVYRALPIMVEAAVIREVDVGRDHKYYIANRDVGGVKIELVCLDCD
ncbi:MAG: transcriptional repressor [Pseudomonas sp.]